MSTFITTEFEACVLNEDTPGAVRLLGIGADVNFYQNNGRPFCFLVIEKGMTKLFAEMINRGLDADMRSTEGISPVLWAARFRRHEILRLCMNCGAPVNAQDNEGMNAFNYLYAGNYWSNHRERADYYMTQEILMNEMVPFNLYAGRDFTLADECVDVENVIWNQIKQYLLKLVVNFFEIKAGSGLVSCRLCENPDLRIPGDYFVMFAKKGEKELIKNLIAAGVDPNMYNTQQELALVEACAMADKEMVRLLLESGASPFKTDGKGRNALSVGMNADKSTREILIKCGT